MPHPPPPFPSRERTLIPVRFLLAAFFLSPALVFAANAADDSAPPFTEILKIDSHSHIFGDLPEVHAHLRAINARTINVCYHGAGDRLDMMHRETVGLRQKHRDLYGFTSSFDLHRRDEPGYLQDVIAHLDRTFAQGAVAVKIWKEIGLEIKDRTGKFILPDDPRWDPIYAHLARIGKPLHAHIAEPIDAWRPLDPTSAHYHYYSRNPQWHLHGRPEFPGHEALLNARDNIMRKHPTLVVLGAHLGSMEHDLDAIAARLEEFPSFHIEVAARTRDLARHPSDKVRALFLKYPDRILYGIDTTWMPADGQGTPQMREAFLNRLKLQYQADYNYYAGRGEIDYNGRKTQALNLPRSVLEKFYHGNALRLLQLADWTPQEPES